MLIMDDLKKLRPAELKYKNGDGSRIKYGMTKVTKLLLI